MTGIYFHATQGWCTIRTYWKPWKNKRHNKIEKLLVCWETDSNKLWTVTNKPPLNKYGMRSYMLKMYNVFTLFSPSVVFLCTDSRNKLRLIRNKNHLWQCMRRSQDRKHFSKERDWQTECHNYSICIADFNLLHMFFLFSFQFHFSSFIALRSLYWNVSDDEPHHCKENTHNALKGRMLLFGVFAWINWFGWKENEEKHTKYWKKKREKELSLIRLLNKIVSVSKPNVHVLEVIVKLFLNMRIGRQKYTTHYSTSSTATWQLNRISLFSRI